MTRPHHSTRTGLTFVEVLCAVAIIALVGMTTMAALASIIGRQERQLRRLGAAELANRIVLQYMDDRESLPRPGEALEYEGAYYRYELRETPVMIQPARADVAADRAQLVPLSLNRLTNVSVLVWLDEQSGGSVSPQAGVPAYQITRIFDPMPLFWRNPDSLNNTLSNPRLYQRFIDNFIGNGGGPQRGGGQPPGGRPPGGQSPGGQSPGGSKPGGQTPGGTPGGGGPFGSGSGKGKGSP